MTSHTLTYTLTEPEFMKACRTLWAHRAIGVAGNIVAGSALALFGGFMLWQGVPGLVPWLFVLGGLTVLGLNAARDRFWRNYYRNAPKFSAPITTRVSLDGVGVTSAEGENTLPWSHFKNHTILNETLYLIVDQRHFSIIPLSACADQTARSEVEEIVKFNVRRLPRRLL